MRKGWILGLCLMWPLPGVAQELIHYVAAMDSSSWSVTQSNLRCTLEHEIPDYGRAFFYRDAGEAVRGYVEPKAKSLFMGDVLIQSNPAPWGGEPEIDLHEMRLDGGISSFEFSSNLAQQMLLELERGRYPSLLFQDELAGTDPLRLSLAPVNFQDALAEYRECVAQLLPFGFADVRESRVYFPVNRVDVERDAKRILDRVSLYVKEDPTVEAILVEGFADNKGLVEHNRELSRLRAENVMLYLHDRGLPRGLFEVRFYGEKRPTDTNRTLRGRAANRMVQVTLLRRAASLR